MKTVSQVESLRLSNKSSAANWSLTIAHTLNSQMAAIFVLNWFLLVLKYFLNILHINLNQSMSFTLQWFCFSHHFLIFTKIFNHNYLLLTHKYHLIFSSCWNMRLELLSSFHLLKNCIFKQVLYPFLHIFERFSRTLEKNTLESGNR